MYLKVEKIRVLVRSFADQRVVGSTPAESTIFYKNNAALTGQTQLHLLVLSEAL